MVVLHIGTSLAKTPRAGILRGSAEVERLSILYRTKGWLTLAQLLPAWASELADGKTNGSQIEQDLRHFIIEDIMNGRLDDAGPLEDGRRLGLRIITPENRAGYLEGQQAGELLTLARESAEEFSFVSHRLVLMKEAVLDFARRYQLPPPSWWTDATDVAVQSARTGHIESASDAALPERTGAPGRPTSMHLVTQEYHARWERGDILDSIGKEAEALSRWLTNTYPTAPKLTAKTIANNLRSEHRRRLAERRTMRVTTPIS
jgi:hypothetical protein